MATPPSPSASAALRTHSRLEKSTPLSSMPMGGMMMSSTRELTTVPKAAPMTIPTAMSIMLPLTANSLNSLMMLMIVPCCSLLFDFSSQSKLKDRSTRLHSQARQSQHSHRHAQIVTFDTLGALKGHLSYVPVIKENSGPCPTAICLEL